MEYPNQILTDSQSNKVTSYIKHIEKSMCLFVMRVIYMLEMENKI